MRLGIDRIGVWPTTLAMDITRLARHRGRDPDEVRAAYLNDERALSPPWEDPVTMAVNAARTAMGPEDFANVELLLVASETSVDREKPLSTWVHRFLGLPSTCRNLEVKHACYGATGALSLAMAWLASPLSRGGSVLVINTDNALLCLEQPYEYVMGAGAAAVLVSRDPSMLTIETDLTGIYANEISDVMRPTSRVETGNGEASLFSYIEGLQGSWDAYVERAGGPDLDDHFQHHIFHMPFGGMAQRAHRILLGMNGRFGRDDVRTHFERRTLPSLRHNRRMGGTYGASTFIGLLGLLDTPGIAQIGDRVGVFAFGAGSCAEFYSGIVESGAHAAASRADVGALLDARLQLEIDEYEAVERARDASVGRRELAPAKDGLRGWYAERYAGRELLVLDHVHDYVRGYRWS